jgi:hypothetical protein
VKLHFGLGVISLVGEKCPFVELLYLPSKVYFFVAL